MKRLMSVTDFSRGVYDTPFADNLRNDELREGVNIILRARGGYTKRNGCTKAYTTPLPSSAVRRVYRYPGFNLATYGGNTLAKWDGTVIKNNFPTDDLGYQYFTNSKLYLLDGTKYWVYNGTTIAEVTPASGADLTAVKRCKKLKQRGQRMFAYGDPQNPNYLYFSAAGDPTNFTLANAVKTVSDDIDEIVHAEVFHQGLVVFRKRHVHVWYGWDPATDVQFDELDVHSGTEAPDSVVKADNFLIYLGDDSIMALVGIEDNQVNTMRVSPGMGETIAKITNRDKATAIFHDGKYLLAFCDNGTGINNKVMVGYVSMAYNALEEEGGWQKVFPWTIISNWQVNDWLIGSDGSLYFSSGAGMCYKAFDGDTDDGVAIPFSSRHRLNLADAFRVKALKSILLLCEQYEVGVSAIINVAVTAGFGDKEYTVELAVDAEEAAKWGVTRWGSAVWGFSDISKKEISIPERCDRVEVAISSTTTDGKFTLYGLGANYKTKKAKGSKSGITLLS